MARRIKWATHQWGPGKVKTTKVIPSVRRIKAVVETTEQRVNQMTGEACLAIGAGDLRGFLFRLWSTARLEGIDLGRKAERRRQAEDRKGRR